jgi:hypothetical protein
MTRVQWILGILVASAALSLGSVYLYIDNSSDDLSAVFTNDGFDRDFNNVSNTDRIEIDADSYICGKVDSSFLYRWHIYREWTGLFHRGDHIDRRIIPDLAGRILTSEGKYIAGSEGPRIFPIDDPKCAWPNPKTVYLRSHFLMARSPNEYLQWIRIRRGSKYKTIYVRRDLGPRYGLDLKPRDVRSATSKALESDDRKIQEAAAIVLLPVGLAVRENFLAFQKQQEASAQNARRKK